MNVAQTGIGTPLPEIDFAGIRRMIPHRFPMLLVDRCTEIAAFKQATGIKNVTQNEPFFAGHFPHDPIMPGVLIIEAMAQTAALLAIASLGPTAEGSLVYFMAIDEARFRRPVRPGDQLHMQVVLQRYRMSVWRFDGTATVDGEVAAQSTFAAKVVVGHTGGVSVTRSAVAAATKD